VLAVTFVALLRFKPIWLWIVLLVASPFVGIVVSPPALVES